MKSSFKTIIVRFFGENAAKGNDRPSHRLAKKKARRYDAKIAE